MTARAVIRAPTPRRGRAKLLVCGDETPIANSCVAWPLPRRMGLGLAVYACQLVLSCVWMSYFRFETLEWLWRTITYRRLQPMRRRDRAD